MKVIVDGLATEYQDGGAGPVWLYLHGWKDDLHTFDRLVSAIHAHRAVRLDLPGFGGSQMPKTDWGVVDYSRFVKAFLDKLEIAPDVIIGHSLGGRIAMKGIAEGLLEPRRLVLIASAGVAERNEFRAYFYFYIAKFGKFVTSVPPFKKYEENLRRLLYGARFSDYETSGALKGTFLKVVSENLADAARAIKVPTILLWGSNDTQTPLAEGKRLRGYINGSELHVTEGGGHFIHQEYADKLAALIKHFVV